MDKTYSTHSIYVQSLGIMSKLISTTNKQIELSIEPLELSAWAPLATVKEPTDFTYYVQEKC